MFYKAGTGQRIASRKSFSLAIFTLSFLNLLILVLCVFSLFTAVVLLLFLFRFLLFFHWARISRLPFANCRRFPALHDFYVGKCRKMFRTKAENSLGISAAATKRCEQRQREQQDELLRAHLRIAHNEAEHDLDRDDDNDETAATLREKPL